MWWFGIAFILMVVLSFCSYLMGYKRYVKYEEEKNDSQYSKALLFFRMFFVFNIIGLIILIVGYFVRTS